MKFYITIYFLVKPYIKEICSVINLISPCGDIALWLGQYPDITPEKDKLYSAYI